jgi:hypothetical protein
VLRVVLKPGWPAAWRWLSGAPTGWRRPYWVVANHPERGAVWVETAGGSPELVELIRYHEADPPEHWSAETRRRHAILAEADRYN